jgi:hypothetical protein
VGEIPQTVDVSIVPHEGDIKIILHGRTPFLRLGFIISINGSDFKQTD